MLFETTLAQLYQSAIDAFPNTQKRQHAIDTVKITSLDWYPYLGMKTLWIVAGIQSPRTPLRHSQPQPSHGEQTQPMKTYKTQLLFKGVQYYDEPIPTSKKLVDNMGQTYYLGVLTPNHEVNVRCSCPDFHWRFQHEDKLDKSLQGADRKPYQKKTNRPPVNPNQMPGMCKHIMKLIKVVRDSGLLVQ